MARRFSEKQQAALLAKFESWEGSAAAFCRRHRLSYQTFRGWRQRAAENSEAGQSAKFVEIELQAAPPKVGPSVLPPPCQGEVPRRPVAELELGGGVVLRVFAQHGQGGRP